MIPKNYYLVIDRFEIYLYCWEGLREFLILGTGMLSDVVYA